MRSPWVPIRSTLLTSGTPQQPLAHVLGRVLELAEVEPVGGQHVDDRIDVAVFVVDLRPQHPLRQARAQVVELLAGLVEQVGHPLGRRVVAERHRRGHEAGGGVGLDLVEVRQLLQLLLDRVGDLVAHLRRGGAGPARRDDRHLDGEVRVLGPAEPLVGEDPGRREHEDEEQHQRRMADREAREIEAAHRSALRLDRPHRLACLELVRAEHDHPVAVGEAGGDPRRRRPS